MTDAFKGKLSFLKDRVTKRIEQVIVPKSPLSLYDPMLYAVSSSGKQLRPVLLMLVNEALGGDLAQSIHAAVSLELIHNFTLVHDDIMDHDDLRRGRETVFKRWDENVAILAGDGLLVMAYLELAQTSPDSLAKVLHVFSQGILEVCEGQTLDKDFETREEISLQEYYEMIDKKTGQLFAVACQVGALLAGAHEEQTAAMVQYGKMIGRAFQIQDDLLDAISQEYVFGKNIGSDLEEHKKSFLVVHALNSPYRDKCERLIKKEKITSGDIQKIVQIFKKIGTIDAAKNEILQTLSHARNALAELPANENRDFLSELIDTIATRKS
jgi:geranylgeranyl pyrophosphate synthase